MLFGEKPEKIRLKVGDDYLEMQRKASARAENILLARRLGIPNIYISRHLGISRQALQQQIDKYAKKLGLDPGKGARDYMQYECFQCGKPFTTEGRHRKAYCSEECLMAKKLENAKGRPYSRLESKEYTCHGCHRKFERINYLRGIAEHNGCKNVYCSVDCYQQNGLFGRSRPRETAD